MRKLALGVPFAAFSSWILAAGCGSSGSESESEAESEAESEGAATPDCATYCTSIMAACNTTATKQYANMTNCMNSCMAFPLGMSGDTSGDTLGCRIYHAHAASASADAATTHCPHAGPGGAGMCGMNCQGYCDIAMRYCTAQNMAQIYPNMGQCMSTCTQMPDDVTYNTSITGGAHQACLLYHVQEASTVPADHCNGDLSPMSTTCTGTGTMGM